MFGRVDQAESQEIRRLRSKIDDGKSARCMPDAVVATKPEKYRWREPQRRADGQHRESTRLPGGFCWRDRRALAWLRGGRRGMKNQEDYLNVEYGLYGGGVVAARFQMR